MVAELGILIRQRTGFEILMLVEMFCSSNKLNAEYRQPNCNRFTKVYTAL